MAERRLGMSEQDDVPLGLECPKCDHRLRLWRGPWRVGCAFCGHSWALPYTCPYCRALMAVSHEDGRCDPVPTCMSCGYQEAIHGE